MKEKKRSERVALRCDEEHLKLCLVMIWSEERGEKGKGVKFCLVMAGKYLQYH